MAKRHGARAVEHALDEGIVDAARDDQARTGRADLAGVLVDRADHALHRGVHVAVGQHQHRRLAAELEHQPGDIGRRRLHHVNPGGDRSGKGDVVDAGMPHQGHASRCAGTGDHVACAGGKTCLQAQLTQHQAGQRCLLRRLGHHGATGRERRCNAACSSGQRVVPGDDVRRHADGFVQRVGQIVRAQRNAAAFVLVAGACVVFEAVRGACDIALRFDQPLARIQAFDHRQALGVGTDQLRDPAQHLAALRGCCGLPRPVQGGAGGHHRQIDILRITGRELGEALPGAGVEGLHPPAAHRRAPLAGNEMPVWQAGQRAGGPGFTDQCRQRRVVRGLFHPGSLAW